MAEVAKARILVEGVLQGVGYRAMVKQAARFLGVKGLVRNLDDGEVEVFCEGVKAKIKRFLKLIDVKGKPDDIISINVTSIDCFWEDEKGYSEAWKPYRGFEIDYGILSLEPSQESALEDHEYGKLYFSMFRSELKGFRQDTKTSFNQMNKKYDTISKNVANIKEVPNELRKLRQTTKKFLTTIAQRR